MILIQNRFFKKDTIAIKKVFILLFLFFLLTHLSFCTRAIRRPALRLEETRVDIVTAALNKNYSHLKTMKGWGRLTVETPQMSQSASSRVILNRPDSVYVKVEAVFGIDVGWLFSDRSSFLYYTPHSNICYTGAFDSLKRVNPISFDLTFDRFIQTLAGLEMIPKLKNGRVQQSGDNLLLFGINGNYFHRYWIDPQKGVVIRSEVRDSLNNIIFTTEYQRFTKINDVIIPRTIRIQYPIKKERLTLFYNKIEINKKLSKNDFRTKIPDSALKVQL